MKEMAVVRKLFRERFDADGRMITLVNNPKTAARFPVASATALARTLDRIGEVLDPEEDVLFLYLTLARVRRPSPRDAVLAAAARRHRPGDAQTDAGRVRASSGA